MDNNEHDLSIFLDEISSYSGDIFYNFVKKFVGEVEGEILQVQCIKNVQILLHVPDIFLFFQINNKNTTELKQQACFIGDDNQFIIRPGIKSNIERFINLLKRHHESKLAGTSSTSSSSTTFNNDKISSCMCNSNNINMKAEDDQTKSFGDIFISNFFKNKQQSNNHYKFGDVVTKFASVLNVLVGHNGYEFIRLNLPGTLPSITTLNNYNRTLNLRLIECEFRFDLLKDYLDSIGSEFVFAVCAIRCYIT